MSLNYKNSKKCILDIISLIKNRQEKEAGDIFESFTTEWHLAYGDYIQIYNTNNPEKIPFHILEKINAVQLLNKGGASIGIDKIAVTRHGEIDIHQDKSTIHIDSKVSIQKATGMMSLRNNPLKNVRNYVLNVLNHDVSRHFDVWSEQKPLIFTYDNFIPSELNQDEKQKDKAFWKGITSKNKNIIASLNNFTPRDSNQSNYIQDTVNAISTQLQNTGEATVRTKGSGALGKSVLDTIIECVTQNNEFNSKMSQSPAPVSVTFYHSSKTLQDNGWTEVQFRRGQNIFDEIIIVSGTDVKEDRFFKSRNANAIVERIIDAMELNKSVKLITLYHHAEIIQDVRRLLKKKYKGFDYWYRRRDENDWGVSNKHSSFAPSYDDRTKSIVSHGSSGTERIGGKLDYGIDNIKIHGPLVHDYSWPQAEKDGLVKPLTLIVPTAKASDLIKLFPQFTNKKMNELDLNLRVDGVQVDGTFPTLNYLMKIAMLNKALIQNPHIKRILQFGNRNKNNQLIKENWKWVSKKILGNSIPEKEIKNIHFEIMNDDDFNDEYLKSHDMAIKRAKKNNKYIIGSCRLFNRGYNDLFEPKHHAAFNIDPRNVVNLVQEIWRVVRLDKSDDPFAYFICPLIYNDLSNEPGWEEQGLEQIEQILQNNQNIAEEFASITQNPSKRQKQKKHSQVQFFNYEEFDPTLINDLIKVVGHRGRYHLHNNLYLEAHNWLFNEYMKLSEPENAQWKGKIHKRFFKIKKFKPIYEGYANWIVWRERFFHCKYLTQVDREIGVQMQDNLFEYKEYCRKRKKWMEQKKQTVRKIVLEQRSKQICHHHNFATYHSKIEQMYKFKNRGHTHSYVGKHCIDIVKSKKIDSLITKNIKKVFQLALTKSKDAECMEEWAVLIYNDLNKIGIDCDNLATVLKRFIKEEKHIDLLGAKFCKEFKVAKKLVTTRAMTRARMKKSATTRYRYGNSEILKWLTNKPTYKKIIRKVKNPMPEERKKKIGLANINAYQRKRERLNG